MDNNDLIIYKNSDGNIIVDAIFKDETLWLTQKGMSKVFDCTTDNFSCYVFSYGDLHCSSYSPDGYCFAGKGGTSYCG